MRWYILRALLAKEWQRHLANRGGITLAILLVAAAVLLSVFAPKEAAAGTGMVGGVHHCFVDYDKETPFVAHLKENRPPELKEQIRFRKMDPASIGTLVNAHTGTGSIHLRQDEGQGKPARLTVFVWHPEGDPTALAAYEAWFWRESRRFHASRARQVLPGLPDDPNFGTGRENDWIVVDSHRRLQEQVDAGLAAQNSRADFLSPVRPPDLEINRQGLGGKVLDFRAAVATGLVVFSLYFACVYLLPTLNCEERERGVLLAQALSPASPTEIVTAKFLFYPVFGMGLAATLAAIYKTEILSSLFFWLALFSVGSGFLGIGMTIATLARTQRAAFLGGMCYLLCVSMVLLICATNNIPVLPWLAIEYHGPRILHAALSGNVYTYHWGHLLGATLLAIGWLVAAGWLFRRRGWQ